MDFTDQLERIFQKLKDLKKLDKDFLCFGAYKHRYKLNPKLSESEIAQFEEDHNITLPEEYKAFLLHIGNGGAGPYYGLEKLENGLYIDLDYKNENEKIKLSEPFPFTKPWNLIAESFEKDISDEAYTELENEYFDDKWINGLLRVSNYGCGIFMNLVVTGEEYGNIWVDNRCNDGGLCPDPFFDQEGRTTFLDWYELWLDKELKKLIMV